MLQSIGIISYISVRRLSSVNLEQLPLERWTGAPLKSGVGSSTGGSADSTDGPSIFGPTATGGFTQALLGDSFVITVKDINYDTKNEDVPSPTPPRLIFTGDATPGSPTGAYLKNPYPTYPPVQFATNYQLAQQEAVRLRIVLSSISRTLRLKSVLHLISGRRSRVKTGTNFHPQLTLAPTAGCTAALA